MPRLFVGLEIPPEIRDRLMALRGGLPGARWSAPEDYHLTLRFIGDVDGRTAHDIEEELATLAAQAPEITLCGLGTFGGQKPHSLHAEIIAHPALRSLQAETESCLRRVGLPAEGRKFVPHITLARLRGASVLDLADYLASRSPEARGTFTATRLALFSARDQVGGGPYLVEAAYPLPMHGAP